MGAMKARIFLPSVVPVAEEGRPSQNRMIVDASKGSGHWSGPGAPRARGWWRFRWSDVLWTLVYPQGGQRILPTMSGAILIALAFAVGSAAYNTDNNILFITLSLLLACLILSGVLSTLNFRGVRWRVLLAPPFRAGQPAVATIELANTKRWLPSYGLWFELAAVPAPPVPAAGPAAKDRRSVLDAVMGRGPKDQRSVRAILDAVGKGRVAGRLFLRSKLPPGGEARLEWTFRPPRRGRHRFALEGVGSLFPFGFLRKHLSSGMRHELVVWPAPVEYRAWGEASSRPRPAGVHVSRAGQGDDLFALRPYRTGDSHRLVHWKASARSQQLVVRQFSAESHDRFSLWVQTAAEVWVKPEQFELMLGLAATLAEDLFRAGKLGSVALDDEPPRAVARVPDLEAFLDRLAVAEPVPLAAPSPDPHLPAPTRRNLLTFAPDGPNGVAAYADGKRTAAT
jgi:uncharacterized protein (DUF58 family)